VHVNEEWNVWGGEVGEQGQGEGVGDFGCHAEEWGSPGQQDYLVAVQIAQHKMRLVKEFELKGREAGDDGDELGVVESIGGGVLLKLLDAWLLPAPSPAVEDAHNKGC
jgi:hypothetical protein